MSLSEQDREALTEPVYDAYRLGKYGAAEYLPMWHELDTKPTGTPEAERLAAVVEAIVAREVEAALTEAARKVYGDLWKQGNRATRRKAYATGVAWRSAANAAVAILHSLSPDG